MHGQLVLFLKESLASRVRMPALPRISRLDQKSEKSDMHTGPCSKQVRLAEGTKEEPDTTLCDLDLLRREVEG